MDVDVLIIGAGAAGLMCAVEAGKRGRRVLVAEHAERVGKKILISGGGRCNFTNLYSNPKNFISQNEHFCKSALSRYTPSDFISWVEKHGIEYYEKTLGQLFCKLSAKKITSLLLQECHEAHVKILLNCKINRVQKNSAEKFEVESNQGTLSAASLVVATGGLSFPHMGASDLGYRIAHQFGLRVHDCRPALVPLLWKPEDLQRFAELSGISLPVEISCKGQYFRENLLFTHRGLSGPAILQISSYWTLGEAIHIDLLPDVDILSWLIERKKRGEKSQLKNLLNEFFPKRFAHLWCQYFAPSQPLNRYSEKQLHEIDHQLHHWKIFPAGTEGYGKAEVTLGGIDTEELFSKTLESRKVPGLYFVGEVIDVTGHLGGHNFQWAWASGFAAGQVV
jgi:predicted Rossmann fold flavoprotein